MKHLASPVAALLLAAGLAACGSSSAPTVDADMAALIKAQCQEDLRCCKSPGDLMSVSGGAWTDEAGCEAYQAVRSEGTTALLDLAIKQGYLVPDDAHVQACVAAMGAAKCADFSTQPAACDFNLLFDGKVGTGGQCFLDAECGKGSHCYMASSGGSPTTGGVCVPYQQVKQPCLADSDCDPSLYCNARTFVCAKYGEKGAPCSYVSSPPVSGGTQLDKCDSATTDCDTSSLTCEPYAEAGASCTTIQCDPSMLSLACNGTICTGPGMGGVGAPCSSDTDCMPSLFCYQDPSSGSTSCATRLTTGSTCDPYGYSADPCVAGDYCYTDPASGSSQCAAQHPIGATCSTDLDCMNGLYCNLGASPSTCAMQKANGSPCSGGDQCLSGNCDTYGTGLCVPSMSGMICSG